MRINSLIKIFTIALTAGTIFGFVVFNFFLAKSVEIQINEQVNDLESNTAKVFQFQKELLASTASALSNDLELKKLLLAKKSSQLKANYMPLFETLKKTHGITHFYFHLPNRVNLIRLHSPNESGDLVNRKTLIDAQSTGMQTNGLEQGLSGNITLRLVSPVFYNGKTIGFIELGSEITYLMSKISTGSDFTYTVLVDKKFLDEDVWKAKKSKFNEHSNWNTFSNYIMSASSEKNISSDYFLKIQEAIKLESTKPISDLQKKVNLFWKSSPLVNSDGNKIGFILSCIKLDSFIDPVLKLFLLTGIGLFIITTVVYYTSYKILQKIHLGQEALSSAARLAALGEMTSQIAHEINNPLAVVIYQAAKIIKNVEKNNLDPALFLESSTQISKMGNRISKTITSIRTNSRNGSHDVYEASSVKTILEDSIEVCTKRYKDAKVSLTLEIGNDIQIKCQSSEISQVVLNLLTNALDAVATLPTKWVKVVVINETGICKIQIIDSGNGIPEKTVAKMMDPFFTTKGLHSGTGLGLSISKDIISRHQGQFYYDKKCLNTTFVIELPIEQN